MEVTKTAEELHAALTAEQAKSKQLEIERDQERDARGKAEQSLLTANTKAVDLDKQVTTEREGRVVAEKGLADANLVIDQLNKAIGEKTGDAPKAHTAKLGTDTYRFVVPQFQLAGFGKVVAKEVKNNSDVLKALVAAGSKVIELVPAK